ncbi:MAG TPA: RagB/SusD family nutrient uptake outer membrane protein [Puia sp.]|nr:RagB/SusD family nutrient uptake outer membrane protein [Puia sp.]
MKKLKYISPILVLALLTVSCHREDLTPQSQTLVGNNSAFSTPARIYNQVIGLYGALKAGGLYGGRFQIAGDVKADNFIDELNNLVTDQDVWTGNPTNSATAVVNQWSAAYLAINNCNVFIEGMNETGTKMVGATLGNQYISEAKVIRAICYYGLLQFWANAYTKDGGASLGVPLRITAITAPGSSNQIRSKVADCYTQIVKDLTDAEAGLPSSYSATATNNAAYWNATRATVNTATALLTRVYLTMGNWAGVISEANKIVSATAPFTAPSGVAFALQSDVTKVFTAPYTTTENILFLPMSSTSGDNPGTQNQMGYYFSPSKGVVSGGTGNGEFSLNPNGVISDPTWKSTDRRWAFIATSTSGGKKWCNKFPAPSPYTDYTPVIRYSEVLLNLAEARTRSTNSVDPQAVALLNAVRQRSDATTTFAPASVSALIADILQERNIEFLGEGLRNNDLVRLQMPIPTKGSAPAKNPGDQGYIWPISANELTLNTLCVDN